MLGSMEWRADGQVKEELEAKRKEYIKYQETAGENVKDILKRKCSCTISFCDSNRSKYMAFQMKRSYKILVCFAYIFEGCNYVFLFPELLDLPACLKKK